jgi:hypothetical protein
MDPGWAAIIAALIAIAGSVLAIYLQRAPAGPAGADGGSGAGAGGQTSSTSSGSATSTTGSPTAPTVSLVSQLPESQRQIVRTAAQSLVDGAKGLPLSMKDPFDGNDYAWPLGDSTYAGGVTCSLSLADGHYVMSMRSVDGPAFCRSGPPRSIQNFVLSLDLSLSSGRNADLFVYYRSDPTAENYYYLSLSPQTQTLAVGAVVAGAVSPVVPATFVPEIKVTGVNTPSVIVLGTSQAVFVNGQLVALITDESRLPGAGQILLVMRLNEAHAQEQLTVDNLDLRGS